MKDIIKVTLGKDHVFNTSNKTIGRSNENIITGLEITLDESLVDYWFYLDFILPSGASYKTSRLDVIGNVVTYNIPNALLGLSGTLKVQAVLQKESGEVWKSTIESYKVNQSINASDDIPNKEDFITNAQKILDETTELNEEVKTGLTPTIGENENWFICGEDTGKTSRGPKGDTYEITDEDYEEIGEQVKTDIQPLMNDVAETSNNALEVAKSAESIAKGKSQSIVFETFEELEVWLKDETNKGTGLIGDNLYIKQTWIDEEETVRQPDYWITEVLEEPNELGYYYEISDLGVEHPDLTNLLSKDEIKEKYLLITYEDKTTETVKLVIYK